MSRRRVRKPPLMGYAYCLLCRWPLRTDYRRGEAFCHNPDCPKGVPPYYGALRVQEYAS